MAITHSCPHCGTVLTRVRPIRDPHYGLPLVICPSCGRAWLRRRHPIQQRWRAFARLQISVCTLVAQIVLLLSFAAANVGIISGLEPMLREANLRDSLQHERWAFAYMAIPLPVLVGIWLTTGLSHWRRRTAWAAWAGLVACLLAIQPILRPLFARLAELCGLPVTSPSFAVESWLRRLAILASTMVIATAGIPLGRALRIAFGRHRAHHWRRRRARLRTRRAAA